MSDLIRRRDAVSRMSDLLMVKFQGQRLPTWNDVYQAMNDIPSAEPERKWIPVTERLPGEEKQDYWVCTDTGYQCQCRWTNDVYGFGASDRWNWKIFDIPQYQKVVAWMPLPEPWRGEK